MILARTTRSVFLGRGRPPEVRSVPIPLQVPSPLQSKTTESQGLCHFTWCGRRDLNPHESLHWNLKPARLPIPPRPHIKFVLFSLRQDSELATALPAQSARMAEPFYKNAVHSSSPRCGLFRHVRLLRLRFSRLNMISHFYHFVNSFRCINSKKVST